ncbi:MAG: aminotransferase class V-fold PLP-dependent enzyme, partial [Clostridia bacterium]|nr:aminotransferase class V-fold PLP-dependent enzyme [Clostridia bacterium]
IVLLNIKGKQSAETADELSQKGVFVRGGLHCAPLMHRWLGTIERGAVRFSFGRNIGLFKTLFAVRILKKIAQKR